jgi:hypothetical protein
LKSEAEPAVASTAPTLEGGTEAPGLLIPSMPMGFLFTKDASSEIANRVLDHIVTRFEHIGKSGVFSAFSTDFLLKLEVVHILLSVQRHFAAHWVSPG